MQNSDSLRFHSVLNATESKSLKIVLQRKRMFSNEDASLSAKRNEAYCGFSFTKTINWCWGTSRVARGITHTRSCTLEHRNPNRAYISPRPSICRCVTEHRLIVLEIYISRTKLPLSNHSIENHPPASGFPALLQIATVATDYVGKRRGSPNESWSLASSTPKSAKLVDESTMSHREPDTRHPPLLDLLFRSIDVICRRVLTG